MVVITEQQMEAVPLLVCHQAWRSWPAPTFEYFPDNCCGPGHGLIEKFVPDYCLWLKISPACYNHDFEWQFCEPTWNDFRASNSRLFANLKAIIDHRSHNVFMRAIRRHIAVGYENAVDIAGRKVFWSLKKEQGYEIPESAMRFANV